MRVCSSVGYTRYPLQGKRTEVSRRPFRIEFLSKRRSNKMEKTCAERYADCMDTCQKRKDPCPCMNGCADLLQRCGRDAGAGGPDGGPGPVSLTNQSIRNLLKLYAGKSRKRQMKYSEAIGMALRIYTLRPKLKAARLAANARARKRSKRKA